MKLAYAMTFSKSQGQTFKKFGIYLNFACFARGQLYVTFSRAKSKSDVSVQISVQKGVYNTKNVFLHSVLVYISECFGKKILWCLIMHGSNFGYDGDWDSVDFDFGGGDGSFYGIGQSFFFLFSVHLSAQMVGNILMVYIPTCMFSIQRKRLDMFKVV